jgi:hypothetical protein
MSAEISARMGSPTRNDAERELLALRESGYSVVESAYVVAKSCRISLAEAKELIVKVESEHDRWNAMEDFHSSLIDP